MKCPKCGSNLDIETRFCSYCGTENPFAKQHREDMQKYSEDYRSTKEEVIANSKKFNRKTFRVTVVAITVAAIAIAILLSVFNHDLSRSYRRKVGEKNVVKYIDDVRAYMAVDDYINVSRLIESKNMRFMYGKPYYDYQEVKTASYNFAQLFSYMMEISQPADLGGKQIVSYISSNVKSIYRDSSSTNEEVNTYLEHLKADTGLMLKTYLGLTDEEIENLCYMTDAARTMLIEEACTNVRSK